MNPKASPKIIAGLLLALLLALSGPQAQAQELPRRLVNRWGMEFILVPAGSYPVCLGRESDERGPGYAELGAFYLQVTEVTQAQWRAVGADDRFGPPDTGADALPARGLSHGDAQNLAVKMNKTVGGYLYRLPSEAEWEAACRAGEEGTEPDADRLATAAWFRANSGGRPHPVAGKTPNKLGFHDLLGNLYEWCQEAYSPKDCPGPAEGDPTDPTQGLYRVLRGGSYNSTPATARCGWRFFFEPTLRHPEHGCRLVRTAVPLTEREK